MSEEKIQIAIYKINEDINLFSTSGSNFSILCDKIENKGFSPQVLKPDLNSDYEIALFYKNNKLTPKWKSFFNEIVKKRQNILKKDQSWSESFVLILLNRSSDNLYAITGGIGYHKIQEYIVDDFGMDIISRLIKKDDKILKAVKEKSFMGGILGTTKYFRNNYNLYENDSFGKIYQELKSGLNKNILKDRFGFSDNDLKRDSNCIAKSSFKLNKAISFEQLFKIIEGCESIYNDQNLTPISINNVEKIQKKKNSDLINSLEKKIFNQLWERFCNKEDSFDFDLCHKDFEKYLTASYYIVKRNNSNNNYFGEKVFEKSENTNELFEEIHKMEDNPQNEQEFINLIKSLKIYSYTEDDENTPLTKGTFIHHVFGDVPHEDRKYFLIENSWYRIKDAFINELNNSCESFIKDNYNEILNKKWDYPSENENKYNSKFISDNRTIVLDKIIPDNIEPCDILKWDDTNLYFFHVKAGFGNTMRDLCSQVYIAAKTINKDINSSKQYIEKIYNHLINKKGSEDDYFNKVAKQTEKITKNVFMNLFINKKPVFVLAVLDIAKTERSIRTNISDFRSNIAKFSLHDLEIDMKGLGVEFKITQILKK